MTGGGVWGHGVITVVSTQVPTWTTITTEKTSANRMKLKRHRKDKYKQPTVCYLKMWSIFNSKLTV